MTDREKVIKGLEIHTKPNSRCVGCPYPNNGLCGDQLYVDALALLKEQPEIIRCKDCEHYTGGFDGYCNRWFRRAGGEMAFCSSGRKR